MQMHEHASQRGTWLYDLSAARPPGAGRDQALLSASAAASRVGPQHEVRPSISILSAPLAVWQSLVLAAPLISAVK